ncbi:Signal transduction histidine kinase [Agromyces sp. CF514]|uniref:sensor histidine kinase n=1 Tax=Agromyces sp. CF514 TaxID=1881031 RepID=UPI0008E40C53|nr:histidine kinase [Agromyces sp. CF514]SFR74657.1 Signal transduction histidine kinase [Agromyces sp. CF514]
MSQHDVDTMRDLSDPRPRVPAWVGDVIAGIVIVGFAFAPVHVPEAAYAPPSTFALVLTAIAIAVLPLRRRWPIPVLGAEILLFGAVAFVSGELAPGIGVAMGIAMFGVTNRSPRRTGIIVAVCAVAAVIVLSLPVTIGSPLQPRVGQFALLLAFAAAAGDATRSRREYIRAITERAERAEQTREAEARRRVTEERLRIARDLHDAVAHQISVISLNAGVASSAIDTRPEKAKESLATIRSASRTVLGEIGGLLEVLRSDEDDPRTAPQPSLDRFDDLTRRFGESGLEVTVRVEGDLAGVVGATGLVAYRVVQEALTNAHKHGAEHRAHVLLAVGDHEVTIVVTNPIDANRGSGRDGDAFVAGGGTAPGSRLGLTGLRERVATVRGTVETGPAPGGWRLTAVLPLAVEAAS